MGKLAVFYDKIQKDYDVDVINLTKQKLKTKQKPNKEETKEQEKSFLDLDKKQVKDLDDNLLKESGKYYIYDVMAYKRGVKQALQDSRLEVIEKSDFSITSWVKENKYKIPKKNMGKFTKRVLELTPKELKQIDLSLKRYNYFSKLKREWEEQQVANKR